MTNRDEDDKEEEWPNELNDQLDLKESRTYKMLPVHQILSPNPITYCTRVFTNNQLFRFFSVRRKCGHLVPPTISDILPEQEEKLSEKSHGSQQLLAMMRSWKTKYCEKTVQVPDVD